MKTKTGIKVWFKWNTEREGLALMIQCMYPQGLQDMGVITIHVLYLCMLGLNVLHNGKQEWPDSLMFIFAFTGHCLNHHWYWWLADQ